MTFEAVLMSGARWMRRKSWGRRKRWAYITMAGEVIGVADEDRDKDDWLVSHRTPHDANVEITAPISMREKPRKPTND